MGFWSELFPGWLGGITDAYLSGYKYLDQADSAASIDQATKQKIDALTLEYLKKLNPEIPGDLAGNTLSTALPIGLGKQTGRINTSRDKDWYAVPVLKGYDYSITVVPNDSEGLTITPFHVVRETLENPARLRENGAVITGQDWVDGRQAARLLGLRAHHGQEADQKGEVSL
jgi:hypothetical protein